MWRTYIKMNPGIYAVSQSIWHNSDTDTKGYLIMALPILKSVITLEYANAFSMQNYVLYLVNKS